MEALGMLFMQQLTTGMEEYCRILASELPPTGEESSPHRFSNGFFTELCTAAMQQQAEQH